MFMNQFSIRDIENLCGVKAHTLRVWEQRYNLFVAKRKESQHRTYDSDDLKELLRISFLYHNGYKISRIAGMNSQQIEQEIEKIKPESGNYDIFVHQLTEASISLDKESFEKIVNGLVLRIGLEKCVLYVFYPFLQRIGLLWMTNHLIPAQEHFSSHIIRKKIICATDGFEVNNNDLNIVIFSPPGELHEIPLLLVNYFFRKQGIRTTYFGTGVNIETLNYYATHHTVTHFYTHVVTQLDSNGLNESVSSLCKSFPGQKIVISGPACSCIHEKPDNLYHLKSIDEVIEYTRLLVKENSQIS
jgi:MerR family transcriptional regulator, light-induced transcriptional regulator